MLANHIALHTSGLGRILLLDHLTTIAIMIICMSHQRMMGTVSIVVRP